MSAIEVIDSTPSAPSLTVHRIRVLPNRFGALMLLVLVVMLLGSINYNNNLGYGLTFLLMGTWCAALLHGYRNLRGIDIIGSKVTPVFAGDSAQIEFFIRNNHEQPAYGLHIRIVDNQSGAKAVEPALSQEFTVEAGATHSVRIAVPTQRRGLLLLPAIEVHSDFPLGTATAIKYFPVRTEVVVYPRPAGALPLPVAEDSRIYAQGSTQLGADDFAGLRAYRPGDSLRHIAWKIHARDRGLHLKQFAGSGSEVTHLSLYGLRRIEDIELRFSQLSRWVLDAETLGIPYSLTLNDQSIDTGTGTIHRDRCLRALAMAHIA
ncbi:MAG: DUF58 domain-containing protein [Gammaproteobacteria bacterium]